MDSVTGGIVGPAGSCASLQRVQTERCDEASPGAESGVQGRSPDAWGDATPEANDEDRGSPAILHSGGAEQASGTVEMNTATPAHLADSISAVPAGSA